MLFDENDIFSILNHRSKLKELEIAKIETAEKLDEVRETLDKLDDPEEVERFAREKKFFKKDDEDVYVVFYE